MTITPRRVLLLSELTLAALATALSAFAVWRGLFASRQWATYPIYEFLTALLLLMAAVLLTGSALLRPPTLSNKEAHFVGVASALVLVYSALGWRVNIDHLRAVVFFISIGVSTAVVLTAEAVGLRNWQRALTFFGLTFSGVTVLVLTVWLGVASYAEFTADMLLMTDSRPYFADGISILQPAVGIGALVGLVVGSFILWRQRRLVHDSA